jgi:hypothetical protein
LDAYSQSSTRVLSTPPKTASKITLISVDTDPIFDLIDIHRKAAAAHLAAMQLQNRVEKIRGAGRGSWITEQPCHDENDAFEALVGAAVNTVPGLLAKLAYLQELAQSDEWSWVIDDRDGVALHLIESFAASLANISAVPMELQA